MQGLWLSVPMRLMTLSLLVCTALPAAAEAPPRLLSVLSGDWDGDGTTDAVALVPGINGDADLIVYENDGWSGLTPVLTLEAVVFAGSLAGQAPSLNARDATSFALSSEQSAVGRTPWAQHITIAWRDGGFVVSGYDYSFYDRLDLSHYGDCSVNLLTSQYTLDLGPGEDAAEIRREGTTEASQFPLENLTASFMASPCETLFD